MPSDVVVPEQAVTITAAAATAAGIAAAPPPLTVMHDDSLSVSIRHIPHVTRESETDAGSAL